VLRRNTKTPLRSRGAGDFATNAANSKRPQLERATTSLKAIDSSISAPPWRVDRYDDSGVECVWTGFLEQLAVLNLESNQLTAVPHSIGKLGALEELVLSHNKMETVPSSIGSLR